MTSVEVTLIYQQNNVFIVMNIDLLPLGMNDKDRVADSLGGGLPNRSIVLIEGESGTGKSVWCQRMAKGVCTEGYKVSYVSAEEDAVSFIDQMSSLSYAIYRDVLRQNLLFVKSETTVENDTTCLIDQITESEILTRSDLIILDNFGRIIKSDRENGFLDDTESIEDFQKDMNSTISEGKTIVISINPDFVSEDTLNLFRNFATVQIHLKREVIGDDTSSKAHIRQYKNMKDRVDDVINFNIKSGRGISIESRTIA